MKLYEFRFLLIALGFFGSLIVVGFSALFNCEGPVLTDPDSDLGSVLDQNYPVKVFDKTFTHEVVKNRSYKNKTGTIELHKSEIENDFNMNNDTIINIFAIESYKLFYRIPKMVRLKISISFNSGQYRMDITRKHIEEYYNLKTKDITVYNHNYVPIFREYWQNQFINKYNNNKSKRAFVSRFVIYYQ